MSRVDYLALRLTSGSTVYVRPEAITAVLDVPSGHTLVTLEYAHAPLTVLNDPYELFEALERGNHKRHAVGGRR